MNKAILMGRLTKDPELKSTNNGVSVCSFTVAVDRRFKNQQGEREADFIPVVAWRQTAEFVGKYFQKGQRIALVGSIQVRHWDDEHGNRRYMTEIIADEVYFADSKTENSGGNYNRSNNNSFQNTQNNQNTSAPSRNTNDDFSDGFFEAPDDETALPFDL